MIALAASAASAQTITASPSVAYFTARGGQAAAQKFSLSNDGDEPIRFTLRRTDFAHDDKGEMIFPAPGSSKRGLGNWLTEPPKELIVPAKGTASFDGAALIPPSIAPGTYFGGYFALVSSEPSKAAAAAAAAGGKRKIVTQVHIATQLALLMHVDVVAGDGKKPAATLSMSSLKVLQPSGSKPLTFEAELDNPSEYEYGPEGTVAVFDSAGKALGKASFTRANLWPLSSRKFSAPLPLQLEPGTYRAFVAFTSDDLPVITRQEPFAVQAGPRAAPRRTSAPGPEKTQRAP